jgi:hypothetical protein
MDPTPTPTPTDIPTPTPTVVPDPSVVHVAALAPDQWFVVCVFMGIALFALALMVVFAWKR